MKTPIPLPLAGWQEASGAGIGFMCKRCFLGWCYVSRTSGVDPKRFDAFNLGDAAATGIGTPVRSQRIILLLCAVALSAVSVSMAGGIGFIGLAAPHLARRLVGPMHRHLIPAARAYRYGYSGERRYNRANDLST